MVQPKNALSRGLAPTKGRIAAVALAMLGLIGDPVAAVQDAMRIVTSNDDTCGNVCLKRGKVFCGREDFQAGYCCAAEGCKGTILEEAPLCSNATNDELLKYLVCPLIKNCGQKVFKANGQKSIEISINPFEAFMQVDDKCSYLLSVDEYKQGDMIELSAIDSLKMDLVLYHGGYSLGSASQKTKLANGKRYLIDGTKKLFLLANTVNSSAIGKPYFSVSMKKISNASPVNKAAEGVISILNDKKIISNLVTETNKIDNNNIIGIYSSKVAERDMQNQSMESADVALLSIMWVCIGIAVVVSVFICVTVSCRRMLARSLKVAHFKMPENFQITTEPGNFETHNDQQEGPYDAKKCGNMWQEIAISNEKQGKVIAKIAEQIPTKSRNFKQTIGSSRASKKTIDIEFPQPTVMETEMMDMEGINAFNTDDALKQEVNPTHAVNPSVFGRETHRFDFNSSRTLNEKKMFSPGEFKFSTPAIRSGVRVNEFDQNKENDSIVFFDGKEVSPITLDRQNFALQATISVATHIDETKRTISQTGIREFNRGGDSAKSKYSLGSEEPSIENGQGLGNTTENARSKRRKVKSSTTKSGNNAKAEAINY